MIKQVILCVLLILFSSDTFKVKFVGVTDGDTIVVLDSTNQ